MSRKKLSKYMQQKKDMVMEELYHHRFLTSISGLSIKFTGYGKTLTVNENDNENDILVENQMLVSCTHFI